MPTMTRGTHYDLAVIGAASGRLFAFVLAERMGARAGSGSLSRSVARARRTSVVGTAHAALAPSASAAAELIYPMGYIANMNASETVPGSTIEVESS